MKLIKVKTMSGYIQKRLKKIGEKKALNLKDKSEVTIGPSESMSKSKKNTVDPEKMINEYGADAVRWFILSDSPPEKDVQWSDSGVSLLQINFYKKYGI